MSVPTSDVQGRVAVRAALPRAPWGPRVLGVVLLLAGLFLCWEAYDSADGDFAPHGPWLAPLVVTAGWVVLAAWYLVSQFIRPDQPAGAPVPDATDDAEQAATVQWLTPALLGVALVGYVLALDPFGFVLASTVFFVAAARILGSHHTIRDVLVAVPLTLGIYFGFTQLLEITLPSGVMPL
jgi:putative tricarboxylic transport membrane protein